MAPTKYDVAVIGGSFGGMSAALQLARAARTIAIIDDNKQINARVAQSFGFLGSDGVTPAEFADRARGQLTRYANVHWIPDLATDFDGTQNDFRIGLAGGSTVQARRIILACGTQFQLPDIPGLAKLWGRTAFNCPYCHAYEHKGRRLAILRLDKAPLYEALLYPDWGPVTLLMNGQRLPDQEARLVASRGTSVKTLTVARLEPPCRVIYDDGTSDDFSALFLNPRYAAPAIARNSRCEIANTSNGSLLKVDASGQSSVEGIYGCGNLVTGKATIADVVADGARVGRAVHASFHFRAMVQNG